MISDDSLEKFDAMIDLLDIEALPSCYKWAWGWVEENDGSVAVLATCWGPDVIVRPEYMSDDTFRVLLHRDKMLRYNANAGAEKPV